MLYAWSILLAVALLQESSERTGSRQSVPYSTHVRAAKFGSTCRARNSRERPPLKFMIIFEAAVLPGVRSVTDLTGGSWQALQTAIPVAILRT